MLAGMDMKCGRQYCTAADDTPSAVILRVAVHEQSSVGGSFVSAACRCSVVYNALISR